MEITTLKSHINEHCKALLLIANIDFSENTPYFFELNLFFDGLLNEQLKASFEDQRINVFRIQNYHNDLSLIIVKYSEDSWKADKLSIKNNFLDAHENSEILLIDPNNIYKNIEADLPDFKITKLKLLNS
ncbi:MAG: hypothetical protein U0T83_10145 [Bacteriovoracaceae bacterium]